MLLGRFNTWVDAIHSRTLSPFPQKNSYVYYLKSGVGNATQQLLHFLRSRRELAFVPFEPWHKGPSFLLEGPLSLDDRKSEPLTTSIS